MLRSAAWQDWLGWRAWLCLALCRWVLCSLRRQFVLIEEREGQGGCGRYPHIPFYATLASFFLLLLLLYFIIGGGNGGNGGTGERSGLVLFQVS